MKVEPVTFTLGEDPQVYSLQYDFNKVCDVEELVGMNLTVGSGHPSNYLRAQLMAYLLKAHPTVTLIEAGDLLTQNEDLVISKLKEAMRRAGQMPPETPEEVIETSPPEAQAPDPA